MIAVITNIDADHMETYGTRLRAAAQAFVDFTVSDCRSTAPR
jgi:UDP-N-acetylmuramate-alanine ligase